MLLSRTSILFPRQSFHLHTKSQPENQYNNSIYAIALANRGSSPQWAICIEPKKTKRLFSCSKTQTLVFLAGDKVARSSETLGAMDLVVKILIAENGVEGVEKKVGGLLKGVKESEAWLRDAVAALQAASLVPGFDVEAFGKMASGTLKAQQCHESVAVEADYLEESGMKTEVKGHGEVVENGKKGGFGFWVSKPQGTEKPLHRAYSWERDDDPYGGLM